MNTTVYASKPETFNSMTAEGRQTQRASTLFEQGYRAVSNGDEVTVIRPNGEYYLVDLANNTCECRSYSVNLRRGNPTCKHIEGAELLVEKCNPSLLEQSNELDKRAKRLEQEANLHTVNIGGFLRYDEQGMMLWNECLRLEQEASRLYEMWLHEQRVQEAVR